MSPNTLSRSRKLPRAARRSPKLRVEALGERITPVLGAYDIPAEVLPGTVYDAVASIAAGTGSMLNTHRHILTVGHVGAQNNVGSSPNFKLAANKTITTPALKRTEEPGGDDIAVIELAELGPLHLAGFDIYKNSDEQGKSATHVGYGHTGTGTSGLLYDDDVGVLEMKRLRFQGTSTGGTYKLWLADTPGSKVTITHNSSAGFIENAIELLPSINDVEVTKVHTAPGHPYNGSFEIVFKDVDYADGNVPNMIVQDNVTGSIVTLQNLFDGGSSRLKRKVQNVVSFAGNIDGVPRLRYDFDNGTAAANSYDDGLGLGASEGMGAPSDSGSPVLIGGKIASLHKGPSGNGLDGIADTRDFGEISSSVRVSTYQDFIEDNLDGHYDLVLNMNTQIWGNDGVADSIQVKRVGNNLQIWIGGVLRYQDSMASIDSVKVIGSNDNETIKVDKLAANVPVQVFGGDGNDTIQVAGVAASATLWAEGQYGDDTIVLGYGAQKLTAQIMNAGIQLYGNQGNDTIRIFDNAAIDTSPEYTIGNESFTRTNIDTVGYNAERLELYTKQGGTTGISVKLHESSAGTVEIFTGVKNDSITIGDGDLLGFNEHVIVHAGDGYNTLAIDDSDAIADRTWRTVDNTVFSPGLSGNVEYNDIDSLQIFAGAGDDTLQLWSNPSATAIVANGNGGADTFEIGAGDLDTIGGNLSIQGGAGNDEAVVNDTSDKGSGQYVVGLFGVSKPFFSLGALSVEDLTLNVHATGSTIKIDGTPAVMTHVNGSAGKDQFLLTPTTQDLSQLGGGLVLQGNGGVDDVRLYDKNSTHSSDLFVVTGGTVGRDHFGDLSYEGMEHLTLNLGDAANKVELHGTKATTTVTINGNGGNDWFNITDAPKSSVVLDGGAGFDVMKWSTGDAPSDPDSGFGFITKISIEQTDFPLAP